MAVRGSLSLVISEVAWRVLGEGKENGAADSTGTGYSSMAALDVYSSWKEQYEPKK